MGRTAAVAFVVASGAAAATAHGLSLGSVGTAAVAAYTAAYSYRHADAVGPGDYVTLLRAGLLAYVAGFVVVRPDAAERQAAVAAFVLSAVLDAVDGPVARRYGGTGFGDMVDTEVDGMATLVGATAVVVHGWLPAAYVAVGLARYIFVAGLRVRGLLCMSVSDLSRSRVRESLSALQTGVIAVAISPSLPEVTKAGAYAAMAPFLLWFFRDWLVACGGYNYTEGGIYAMFEPKDIGGPLGAASLAARVLTAVIFAASGATKLLMYSEQVGMFTEWGVPSPGALVPVVGLIELAAGVAVLVGFLGRSAAAVLSLVMVGAFVTAGPNGLNVFSFLLCAFILANGVGGWRLLTEREAIQMATGG